MPRETFFNLDDEKKKKIIDAAVKEFTENQLHKSRVSSIIKEAGIPRGSFYQYFEDIDDLYYFVIDDTFDKLFDVGYKRAELTDDLFEYTRLTFDVDIQSYKNDKRHKFMMNVMKSIGTNIEYLEHHNNKRKNYIIEVLDKMDLSKLKIYTTDEKIKIYEFLQNIKRMVIQRSLMNNLSKDESKIELDFLLNILKNGLLDKE